MEGEPNKKNIIGELKTILEWSSEEVGQHNFLRIRMEDLNNNELLELLQKNNYTILTFAELDNEDMLKLQKILINAQTYMHKGMVDRDLPQGKIALIFTHKAWQEILADHYTFDRWKENTPYTITLEE